MSERTLDTLFELLEAYKVEIPIIQRDYVQGRQDEDTNMVRINLLADMKSAILHETPSLDLNFVYGKAEGEKFIPIDGQQRLTTLFLLHLYAFHDDDSKTDLLKKFTYETRTSSRNFLEKLIENRFDVFTSNLLPSKEIEDSEWFSSGWIYDPTIQSAIVMLDDIKNVFGEVENLALCLLGNGFKPIIFSFLEMKDLGMEDSLYIKLNARGKPLTSFENFKARLIGQLKKLLPNFAPVFEVCFDVNWADLFWSQTNEKFDQTYLTFFGVLLMNKGMCLTDHNWSNTLDFDVINEEIFKTAFYTLNYLCENPERKEVYQFIFKALEDKRTYPQRVLFHTVTTYLYNGKGVSNDSLEQWMRIIKNMVLNTQIDDLDTYNRAIEGINRISDKWDDLLNYFAQNRSITGFAQDQIKEEQVKARIILKDDDFAKEIYKAENHSYFSGQIRSALHYAKKDGQIDMIEFIMYWSKISELFDEAKPKHGNLLRRALLTFGDYTLRVSDYITLCVDDPNEAARTPSLKSLFSNHSAIVKQLLDTIDINFDIAEQLKEIIKESTVSRNDWRYCFIRFPGLFKWMSVSHLRLRNVSGELIIVPNKASNGYNYEVFSVALCELLIKKGMDANCYAELGTWGERYLYVKDLYVHYKKEGFIITDEADEVAFETTSDNPINEAAKYLLA